MARATTTTDVSEHGCSSRESLNYTSLASPSRPAARCATAGVREGASRQLLQLRRAHGSLQQPQFELSNVLTQQHDA